MNKQKTFRTTAQQIDICDGCSIKFAKSSCKIKGDML